MSPVIELINVSHFRNKPFDDLWQEAITPKYKLDRSYKDNMEGSHIGSEEQYDFFLKYVNTISHIS
jgi:hypothetical protein